MTETAPVGGWRDAVVRERRVTPGGVVLRLEVADRVTHWAGQHYVVRLRAEDGYTAQRSYSVASAPGDPLVELYVERLADGEVSGYLADGLAVGDAIDVRGPIGGWFVWRADVPALGVAGGAGVVPLVAMARHAADVGRPERLRLAVSAWTLDHLPYADELVAAGATVVLTREHSDRRRAGRLTAGELAPLLPAEGPCFVCGSAAFAEGATDLLLAAGADPARIRVERFGPSAA